MIVFKNESPSKDFVRFAYSKPYYLFKNILLNLFIVVDLGDTRFTELGYLLGVVDLQMNTSV